jgi:septation ring formation regulator EzrA
MMTATNNTSIPGDNDFRKKIRTLEEKLDDITTQAWDIDEENHFFANCIRDLEFRIDSLNACLTKEKTNASIAEQKCEVAERNTRATNQQFCQLDYKYRLAEKEIEKLRAAKVSDEHMARQLLRLVEENKTLKEELNRIKCMSIIAANEPAEEIAKFKEQTTRLIAENATYACPASKDNTLVACGKCLTCTVKALRAKNEKQESDLEYLNMINNMFYIGCRRILTAGIFKRNKIAEEILKNVDEYRRNVRGQINSEPNKG